MATHALVPLCSQLATNQQLRAITGGTYLGTLVPVGQGAPLMQASLAHCILHSVNGARLLGGAPPHLAGQQLLAAVTGGGTPVRGLLAADASGPGQGSRPSQAQGQAHRGTAG
jgi:hypothetical protein